ncbi:AraC family transcriptional regulator [Winogradskyella sp.]|uniref:helix-turn-helix domain-containing protein n=1 Tax=Winogradskyella sp. TaxID=1883156 RepID=UPI00262E62E0|nr:helix-turn-helix domain-containing protein [Winogradskyella sp.]
MEEVDIEKIRKLNCAGNHLITSRLREIFFSVDNSTYSIKIPIDGEERYKVDNYSYKVKPGEFLIVNQNQSVELAIRSKKDIIGKCIYLDRCLVNEIYNDITKKNYFKESIDRLELNLYHGKYTMKSDSLSKTLAQIVSRDVIPNEEMYFELAFELIKHQIGVNETMNSLSVTKASTKQELHSRLISAKAYMNDNFTGDINIEMISENANISKFHLIRTFKTVYGKTPYNYLTSLRLNKAVDLINIDKMSLDEVAVASGFGDRRNLTRNFKKNLGYNFSTVLNQKALKQFS